MISKAQRRLTGQMLVQTEWTSFVDSCFVSNLSQGAISCITGCVTQFSSETLY